MGSNVTSSVVERQPTRVATWILLIVSVAVLVAIGSRSPGWSSPRDGLLVRSCCI